VTLNAAADQAYTVTWSFAGSPTLTGVSGGTSTIAIGQTTHPAVTAAWAAAGGPHAVDFTISPSLTRAGRPVNVTVTAPVAAGTWQTLSIAPHSRKVTNLGPGDGTVPTFTPTKSIALDATSPTAGVTEAPYKGWNKFIPGEHGFWYLSGGMHSGYPGQEVDRLTLPTSGTVMSNEPDVQPFRPPEGPFSGYFSGGASYIHRMYNVPMTDPSDWRPYPGHQWTQSMWHPDWGYCVRAPYATQTSYPGGSYILNGDTLVGSHAQPGDTASPDTADYITGYVGLNWGTRKWTTYIPNINQDYGGATESGWIGHTGASTWNEFSNSVMFLATGVAGRTHLRAWHRSTNTIQNLGFTEQIGGASGSGGNGVLIEHMEGEKYLILRVDNGTTPPSAAHKLVLFNRRAGVGEGRFFTLTIPSVAFENATNNQDGLSFLIDRNSRRIFWICHPGTGNPIRFFRSTFDAPTTWTEITITPSITIPGYFLDFLKQPLIFRDGFLFFHNFNGAAGSYGWPDGRLNMLRAKVDNGETLPAMAFTRYDYDTQNFGFSAAPTVLGMRAVKHANLACRTTTGEHYVCGGDLGGTYNGSMGKLTFSGNGPGDYLWTETLTETQAAPMDGGSRMKRPSSPDDGAWWYSSSANPNPAFRDKFIHMRGGDGTSYASNPYERTAYRNPAYTAELANWDADNNVVVNCPLHVADMQADGWTVERLLVFDAAKNGFISTGVGSWPVSSGSWTVTHPTLLSGSSTRCGAFDVATNSAFRLTNVSGTPALVRYDLTNQTIRVWNLSRWTDTAGVMGDANRVWHTGAADPAVVGHENDVLANGFGYFYTSAGRWVTCLPGHWEHKALWIDSRDGKLYGVSPQTGYLWCFETRGTETSTADGLVIPFYPAGNRVPLVGTFPGLRSLRNWPPNYITDADPNNYFGNIDGSMNSFLVPFKGGLLWWSNAHHSQGAFGYPLYCFWRRLGFTGDWTVVTTPTELSANTYSCRTHEHDNDEVVMLAGGGHSEFAQDYAGGPAGIPQPRQKYFWRLR
jgi:hypothetical protein